MMPSTPATSMAKMFMWEMISLRLKVIASLQVSWPRDCYDAFRRKGIRTR